MTATCAIIPASGLGERLSKSSKSPGKVFTSIAGQPLIVLTLTAFQECPEIDEIVLVVRGQDIAGVEALVRERLFSKVRAVVAGGDVRQDSVRNGLAAVSDETDIVAIHDGARPMVTSEIIRASIYAARTYGAAIAAVPVIDTIKSSPDGVFISRTLDRTQLFAIQTPQTFRLDVIKIAFERAYADSYFGTDDASLVERLDLPVAVVPGDYENVKVTVPTDIVLAEAIMNKRRAALSDGYDMKSSTRIGHGYDVHRFAAGRKLFLGGVEFSGQEGLLGHSDADVMLHAVADALLGAAGLEDIGHFFPNTDPAFAGIRSTVLLGKVGDILRDKGWIAGNIDVTLIAERPKIAGHTRKMRENIAVALGITADQVSIKATTAEGLGPIGEGLGIECHAVAMIYGMVGGGVTRFSSAKRASSAGTE